MSQFSLVVPFLDDDPMYARGVEFGMLYARLRGGETVIDDTFTLENQEQITLAANRMGWKIERMAAIDGDWFHCRLVKNHAAGATE